MSVLEGNTAYDIIGVKKVEYYEIHTILNMQKDKIYEKILRVDLGNGNHILLRFHSRNKKKLELLEGK